MSIQRLTPAFGYSNHLAIGSAAEEPEWTFEQCWDLLKDATDLERPRFQKIINDHFKPPSHEYELMRRYDAQNSSVHPFAVYLDQMVDKKRITPQMATEILSSAETSREAALSEEMKKHKYLFTQELLNLGFDPLIAQEVQTAYFFYDGYVKQLPMDETKPFQAFHQLLQICQGIKLPHLPFESLYFRHIPYEERPLEELQAYFPLTFLQMLSAEKNYLKSDTMLQFAQGLLEHPIEPKLFYRFLLLYQLSYKSDWLIEKLTSTNKEHLFRNILHLFVTEGLEGLNLIIEIEELDQEFHEELIQDFCNELSNCMRLLPITLSTEAEYIKNRYEAFVEFAKENRL